MHFNVSHSPAKHIVHETLDCEKFPEDGYDQRSDSETKFHVDTSVELLALLDQYSELQFERIATGDEPWVSYVIESDSIFARRREEMIPKFRPGISIKKVMIPVFSQRDS
jgi:hypothetical protein